MPTEKDYDQIIQETLEWLEEENLLPAVEGDLETREKHLSDSIAELENDLINLRL